MREAVVTFTTSIKLNVDEDVTTEEKCDEYDCEENKASETPEGSSPDKKELGLTASIPTEDGRAENKGVNTGQTMVLHMYKISYPEESVDIPFGLWRTLFYDGCDNMERVVSEHLDMLMESSIPEVSIENIRDSKKRDASFLSEWENEVECGYYLAVTTSDISQWNENAADIRVLQEIIQGREEILSKANNSGLCNLLANDYQRYGLEYQKMENGNAEQILFAYMKSIEYTEKSLMFEGKTDSEYKDLLEYIVARYKDIADCERIAGSICDRAREVEYAIKKYLAKR